MLFELTQPTVKFKASTVAEFTTGIYNIIPTQTFNRTALNFQATTQHKPLDRWNTTSLHRNTKTYD